MDRRIGCESIESEEQNFQIFRDFMTRVAKMDELRNVGYQLLLEFQRELGFFMRPPLEKESEVIQNITKDNQTFGLKKYIEAGFRHVYMDARNICKLNLSMQGLQDHLLKAKLLLDELENLSNDAIGEMQVANQNSLRMLDKYLYLVCKDPCSNEANGAVSPDVENSLLYTILMRIQYNMLKCDYEMQEKIVLSLGLSSSSEELESYCLMWELRPYVDEDIANNSWKLIPQFVAPK